MTGGINMKTILIVEDDFHIQDIYRMAFLKKGKYNIETASDGQEALVKLRAHVYDLILLDVMLPKVTGIDVLRAMRSPTSPTHDTPIILITNLGQEDIIKEAFKIGADGYLIKAQFTPQDVVAEVDAFFEQMEQLKQVAPETPGTEPAANIPPVTPTNQTTSAETGGTNQVNQTATTSNQADSASSSSALPASSIPPVTPPTQQPTESVPNKQAGS